MFKTADNFGYSCNLQNFASSSPWYMLGQESIILTILCWVGIAVAVIVPVLLVCHCCCCIFNKRCYMYKCRCCRKNINEEQKDSIPMHTSHI